MIYLIQYSTCMFYTHTHNKYMSLIELFSHKAEKNVL